MSVFDQTVIEGVTGHMNDDHQDDNLLIARAFGYPDATDSVMVSLDETVGVWKVVDAAGEHELPVDWPGAPLSERPQIRKAVVELYKEACRRLNITPRAEHEGTEGEATGGHHGAHGAHGANPHGGNPHEHGNPHAGGNPDTAEDDGPMTFSKMLRSRSWNDHDDSEGAEFMANIMKGQATLDDYVALVVQHYYMYVALEEATLQLVADPQFAAFHVSELNRMRALEEDLEFLLGADWRSEIHALPATQRYADRIEEVARDKWLPGVLAHHYTRYLGDLSGGQMIARRVSKQHGFTQTGVSFYNFQDLGDLAAFKERYRDELDRLGETLDQAERERVLDEVIAAYRFNTEVFIDLAHQKAGTLV